VALLVANGVAQGQNVAPKSATASSTHATSPTAAQRTDLVQKLVSKYGNRLAHAHYMEKNCQPVTWPGWEGYPTELCRYSVTDRASSTTKSADVVMLNASPEKVANWVVTACFDAGTTNPEADCEKLFKNIIGQSGGQFPIAGVVYEDMEGDGWFDAFCFRNGVTCRVEGIDHRTTHPLSAAEIEASLRGKITRVYTYARIASTTPDQYVANGGDKAAGDNNHRTEAWPRIVGELYRKAWNSDDNELIDAWAKANL